MAGACPVSLSIAVANAGGMGAMGALVNPPARSASGWRQFRSASKGMLQLNTWIPDPPQPRNAEQEKRIRQFLASLGTGRAGIGRSRRGAGLQRAVRDVSRSRPACRVLDHGPVPRTGCVTRLKDEGHRVVRHRDHAGGGASGPGRRRRRDRRAGIRGRRTSRFIRSGRGRATDDRPHRARSATGRSHRPPDHRRGRHRGRTGNCGGAHARRERGRDRNRVPALPRSRPRTRPGPTHSTTSSQKTRCRRERSRDDWRVGSRRTT